MVMLRFTHDTITSFSLSADFYSYGIITIKAKDRGDIISGVEYIESILGNRGEVVLA